MYFVDNFILNDEEQIKLVHDINEYCKELSSIYKRFSIVLRLPEDFYKDIYDDDNNWTVVDYYTSFYNFLNICLAEAVKQIELNFLKLRNYNSVEIMDTIIVYGSSVYYFQKFLSNDLFIKTQSMEKINKLIFKLQFQFKTNFYKNFEDYTNSFISICIQEKFLIDKYQREILMYNNLLKDCCERINVLNFDTFLV